MKKTISIIISLNILLVISVCCQIPTKNPLAIDTKIIQKIETEYLGYFPNKTSEIQTIEKFDSLGRLIFWSSDRIGENFKEEKYFYYIGSSELTRRTIEIGGFNSMNNLPDTILIRNNFNNNGKITCKVVTTTKDSLMWIQNFEYNNIGDLVCSSYQKVPTHIKMIMPDFRKDSTFYDYGKNIYKSYTLGEGGILMSSEGKIEPSKSNTSFDSFGNLKENEIIKIDYQYDSKNNWVELKSYSKDSGKLNLKYTKKRRINYRK